MLAQVRTNTMMAMMQSLYFYPTIQTMTNHVHLLQCQYCFMLQPINTSHICSIHENCNKRQKWEKNKNLILWCAMFNISSYLAIENLSSLNENVIFKSVCYPMVSNRHCLSRGLDGTSSKQLRNLNFVKPLGRKVSKTIFYSRFEDSRLKIWFLRLFS